MSPRHDLKSTLAPRHQLIVANVPGAAKTARVDADDESDAASAGGALTLRPAVPADAERMHQVAQAAYQPYVGPIGRSPAPMTADYARIVSSGRAWVAEQHGRLVGFLVLEPRSDHLLLENVAVDPDRQRTGVGSRLLALAEDQARLLGLPEARLFTNAAMTENVEYYLRRGYRQTHRAERDGYRRVFFSKDLQDD